MAGTPDPSLLEQLRAALDSTYEIERELAGGMSRVFVASERALGRRVVIKVLPPQLTAGVNRERFRREIQFAARLQHPHIVPLLTAGQVGEILYYTMPLVEGETLRSRLEREGRLGAASVVSILQDIVDALAYAHNQGLVHRDIKPENILLQRHHALVTDFGVAKALTEALPGSGATTVGIAVGTPAYMAPEQLAADPAADHRVDIYAIGLLAYELLSGASPFTGSSPQQTLARQLTERPAPPNLNRTDVPAALSALIMRCLEKDPSLRWSSAEDLLQALAAVRITSSGMPGITRTERIEVQRSGWRRGLVIGAAAALAVVVALGAYSRWGPGRAVQAKLASPTASADSTDSVTSVGQRAETPVSVAAPSTLTRADSEAIAASVARRMMAQREAAPSLALSQRALDSIRNVVVQSVADSVMRIIGPGRRPGNFGPDLQAITRIAELGRDSGLLIESRRDYRVAVPPVVIGGPEPELRDVGIAIIDFLSSGAERNGGVDIITGAAGRTITRRMEAGLEPGADAAVIGVLRPIAGDSVEVVFELRDGHDPRWAKSLRHAVHRNDIGVLPTVSTPMVMSWIQNRVRESRRIRTLPGLSRLQLDSMTRAAQRMRDALRKPAPGRPDSAPPAPVPPTP